MTDPHQPVTYIEWRVTGDHAFPDIKLAKYDFTWSEQINPQLCDPDAETAARAFMQMQGFRESVVNIRLMRREVTVGPWEDA